MRRFVDCVLVLSLGLLVGCGSRAKVPSESSVRNSVKPGSQTTEFPLSPPDLFKSGGHVAGAPGAKIAEEPNQGPAPQPAAKEETVRKVVYNAAMTVMVKNLDESGDALNDLVEKFQGYVVESNVTGSVGSRRHGLWKARIPVKHYNAFRVAVKKLGITESSSSDSRDVTEEFYDTNSRIETLKREEKSLMVLLESLAKNYSESKEVRRDLWQVREKIEQLEGRLQYLDKLTTMTTFTITLQEEQQRYVTPDPPLTPTPTFPESIRTTFQTSFGLLKTVGKFVTLVLVAASLWLPVLAIVGIPLFVLFRRHKHTTPALAQSEAPPGVSPSNPSTPT
jgi:hypothetical protein